MRAALRRRQRLLVDAQVAGVDLAALAHPLRRLALVGHPHLERRIAQQAPDDRGADRAGAAGHQDPLRTAARPLPFVSMLSSDRYAKTCAAPKQFHGSTTSASPPASEAMRCRGSGPRNSSWLAATTTASAPVTASSNGGVGVARRGSWTSTSASSALEQAHELVGERVAVVVGVALEGEAEHRDLAAVQRPEPALHPLDEEQRHGLVDARHREQHAGRVGALLAEGEVLAQAGPGGEARRRDPAARIVAVDELDDVEDVRAVLLAIHHQEVRQREVRVAQDVRPDLRELGLHGRRLHDRRAEDRKQRADALAGLRADPADDARQRLDLLEEAPGGDPLGRVRDEDVDAAHEPSVLGEVARDEVGRARGDRRAQDDRVAGAQVAEQVVQGRADVAHVDLDVRQRRRAERDDDVVGDRRVGDAIGHLQRAGGVHAVERVLRAGLLERHPRVAHRLQPLGGDVDAEHLQPTVGERNGQREADPTQPDDGNLSGHEAGESTALRARRACGDARTAA